MSAGGAGPTDGRPNIVFVLTDDQDARSVAEMPNVRSLLAERGTTFSNAFATVPLCCPSRATFLRGQYAHNTRVKGNSLPLGGHEKFRSAGLEDSTIATWLDGAGYETAYLGKYMNHYDDTAYVPPGWDRWFGWLGFYASPDGSYRINADGRIETHERAEEHDTDLLRDEAERFVRDKAQEDRPFFLWVAPNAPHEPYYAAERHEGAFAGEPLPRPPSFGEADVSDKPAWVRKKPPPSPGEVERLTGVHRDRLEALRSVDEMVGGLISTLRETGQFDDTYFVYASDNGYMLGEHRLQLKGFPTKSRSKYRSSSGGRACPRDGRRTDWQRTTTSPRPSPTSPASGPRASWMAARWRRCCAGRGRVPKGGGRPSSWSTGTGRIGP